MTSTNSFSLRPIGFVRSQLTDRERAPKQGSEGAPEAWVEIDPIVAEALDGIVAGSEIILLTWLHQGNRSILRVHPRDDPANPLKGVFATPFIGPAESHWAAPRPRTGDHGLRAHAG